MATNATAGADRAAGPRRPEQGRERHDSVELRQRRGGQEARRSRSGVGQPCLQGQHQEADRDDVNVPTVPQFEDEQRVPGVEDHPLGAQAQTEQ